MDTPSRSLLLTLGLTTSLLIGLAQPALAADDKADWQGTLTSIAGTTVPTTLQLQVDTTTYTVNLTVDTKIVRRFYGRSALEEFAVGDTLKVKGTLDPSIDPDTINASYIRDVSIQRKGGTFVGRITSIDAAAKTFVLDVRGKQRPDQTVKVSDATKIYLGHLEGRFDQLAVGQTARVLGVWRKSANLVDADRVHVKLTTRTGTITTLDCAAGTMTLRRGNKDWMVSLLPTTTYRDRTQNTVIACTDLAVSHQVHLRGMRTASTALTALTVIDKGVLKTAKVLNGEVTSVDAGAMTLMFKTKGKQGADYTVNLTAASILVNSEGSAITLANVMVGHDVQVRGPITGTTMTLNLLINKDLP